MQWNRIELVICILLTILLSITLCGGVALWKVCWKSKKSKLISAMQIQFLYHMKQQQVINFINRFFYNQTLLIL